MKQTAAILMISLTLANAFGEDIYVAQTAQGGDTGANAANAHSIAWLNTATNWASGAGKVSQGDTVRLVSNGGNFTTALTVQGDGATNAPITIYFDDASAKFSKTNWNPAILVGAHPYIVVDGATNTNVRIECTANGTGLTYQTDASGISLLQGANNVTLQNLRITNIYKSVSPDDTRYGQPIVAVDVSNFSVLNSRLSDGDTPLGLAYSSQISNITFVGNTILDCNHGIGIGTQTNLVSNVTIASNVINQLDTWDAGPGRHLDAIIIFNNTFNQSATFSNVYIYANQFGPRIGTNNTGAVFVNAYDPFQNVNMRIYNNLFAQTNGQSWANGHVVINGTNCLVANNTFVGATQGVGLGIAIGGMGLSPYYAATLRIANNLFYNIGTPITLGPVNLTGNISGVSSDTNIFYGLYTVGTGAFYETGYRATTFAGWKADYGLDTHSVTNQPSLNANYVPLSTDTIAKGTGADFSSYFTTDYNGDSRSAPWTIGAFNPLVTCTYTLDSYSASANTSGTITSGSSTVAVTTTSGCAWTSVANVAWLTVTSGASGTGSGTTTFTVAANTGVARSGTLTIAGNTFTVNQAGSLANPVATAGRVTISGRVVLR